jgi:hypothetical protein
MASMLRNIAAALAISVGASFALSAPASAQAAAQGEHLVVRGNTLWDLAQSFYGNPFEWRRIWEANRDRVPNPDLIYPGQLLLVPDADGNLIEIMVGPAGGPEPQQVASGARARTIWWEQDEEVAQFGDYQDNVAAVPSQIVEGSPFVLQDPGEDAVGTVGGFGGATEERITRESARRYDRLFIDLDRPVSPGTRLQAYRTGDMVPGLGHVARPTAVIEVVAMAGDRPVVEVVRVYGRLLEGDRLRPVPTYNERIGVFPERIAGGATVAVVEYSETDDQLQGPGGFLFIERPAGVAIGDEYEVRLPGSGDWPEGIFTIVNVGDDYATGRIINLQNPVFEPGVQATLARKMPAG